ncbi:MAG: hypothetical protein ACK56I_05865, partial [bacterium]
PYSIHFRCRCLRHKAACVGEVHIGFFLDAGEVVVRRIVMPRQAVAAAAAIRIDEGDHAFVFADAFQVAADAR